uniref:FERM domain-containing protein n=1 Tax=Caenorhabditis japonica TaxID=281687 RepID=A0A8R1E269_CAEJA
MSDLTTKPLPATKRPRALVRLLDSRQIEIVLHSRLSVDDVLRLIADKLDILFPDARYFCLGFTDNFDNFHWLDSSVILYDLVASTSNPKGILTLSHHVRFFVETIYDVQCASTAKLFFFDIHNQLARHELLVTSEDYFELVAILVSVFVPECHFIKLAEKSESYGYRMYEALNENNDKCILSIGNKGIYVYRRSRHQNLITPYLAYPWRVIDNLYYRDKKFSIEIREPKRNESNENMAEDVMLINDLQLSEAFRHPTTQVSSGRRRSNNQQPRVLLFAFTCHTPLVCRTVWMSAIAQHRFFLERKEMKKKGHQRNTVVDHQELTEKLNRLTSSSSLGSSLPSLSSLHSNSSTGTMPSAKISDGSTSSLPPPMSSVAKPMSTQTPGPADSGEDEEPLHNKTSDEFQRDLEKCEILKAKKTDLEARLRKKIQELKDVCIEEGDITGELPVEINDVVLPGDDFPRLKRRVGTAYSIPDELIKADKADKMSQMETDVELHRRIVAAASRLATDKNTNKSVRKKRQKDLQAARQRLNRLEQGLQQMRHSASKPDISSLNSDGSNNSWAASNSSGPMLTMAMTKSCPTTPRGSVPDLSRHQNDMEDEKDEFDENLEERVSRRAPSAVSRHSLSQRYSGVSSSSTSSGSDSMGLGLPPRPTSRKSQQQQTTSFDDHLDNPLSEVPTNPLYENVGYRSTSYRSSYRQAHYPTIQDEHTQRKRAQSAHSISTDNGPNGRTSTYSVPLNDAAQKFREYDYDDEDVSTPTMEHPSHLTNMRRLTTSISCQAGFATASLDRRCTKPNGGRVSSGGCNTDDMVRQNVTTRITTFPVAPHASTVILSGKPFSSSELPRFQPPPPVARVTHMPRGSLPPYSTQMNMQQTSVPNGKISTNPQMEALLSYYKQQQHQHPSRPAPSQHQQHQHPQQQQQQPKTATIV